jgi:hypothetical protein
MVQRGAKNFESLGAARRDVLSTVEAYNRYQFFEL